MSQREHAGCEPRVARGGPRDAGHADPHRRHRPRRARRRAVRGDGGARPRARPAPGALRPVPRRRRRAPAWSGQCSATRSAAPPPTAGRGRCGPGGPRRATWPTRSSCWRSRRRSPRPRRPAGSTRSRTSCSGSAGSWPAPPSCASALADRAAPVENRAALIEDLLDGQVTDETRRLVRQAVVAPRGRTFDRALETYGQVAADRRSRLVATVTATAPLTEEQRDRLGAALRRIYGARGAPQRPARPRPGGRHPGRDRRRGHRRHGRRPPRRRPPTARRLTSTTRNTHATTSARPTREQGLRHGRADHPAGGDPGRARALRLVATSRSRRARGGRARHRGR